MTRLRLIFGILAALTVGSVQGMPSAMAGAVEGLVLAQGGCASAAAQAQSQTGGQVIRAQMSTQGGQKVCVVTVLVSDPSGAKPATRKTVTIPVN